MIDAEGRYFPSHLSPSQLTLYRLCPLLYRERYVLGLYPPAAPERLFGVAVHAGLEAHFLGQDAEMTFMRRWSGFLNDIDQSLYPLLPALRKRGLDLIEQVIALDLHGEPEVKFAFAAADFKIPFVGVMDLVDARDPEHGTVYDYKTTGYGWNATYVDKQRFQPAIYAQAYAEEHTWLPSFKFIILPRIARGTVQVLDASRSPDEIIACFSDALEIHRAIEAQQWGCTCRGRYHLFDPTGWADFEDEVA